MLIEELPFCIVEQKAIPSKYLSRYVVINVFLPKNISNPDSLSLLLINDGQNLEEMNFSQMLNQLFQKEDITPLICVGVHATKDRLHEYGTAGILDYAGRGTKTEAYKLFILNELLPFIHLEYQIQQFRKTGFAGFSLGGLSALDMVWGHPEIFSITGVFSGSLWWRKKDLTEEYNDETDRIMHQLIKDGKCHPGLKFYFTTGSQDEVADRNNNGIIDSIDDTLALIKELERLGYKNGIDISYTNYDDGKHDIATWAKAMPQFLMWGWGSGANEVQ